MRYPIACLVSALLAMPACAGLPEADEAKAPQTPTRADAPRPEASATEPTAAADVDSLPHLPVLLYQDAKGVLGAPLEWKGGDWGRFALAAGAVVGTAITLDRPVRDAFQRTHNASLDRLAKDLEPFGSSYAIATVGGAYLYGLAAQDSEAKATGVDAFSASLLTGIVIVPALKYAAGRARPDQGFGTYSFKSFSGRESFPSGHTTEAFTVASVITAHYPQAWVQCTAYGLATLAGLSRLEQHAHFTSDVLAGAIIGTTVGKAVAHMNRLKRSGQTARLQIVWAPQIGQDYRGLQVGVVF